MIASNSIFLMSLFPFHQGEFSGEEGAFHRSLENSWKERETFRVTVFTPLQDFSGFSG